MTTLVRGLGLLALILTPSLILLGPPTVLVETGHVTAGSIWLGVVGVGALLLVAYRVGGAAH